MRKKVQNCPFPTVHPCGTEINICIWETLKQWHRRESGSMCWQNVPPCTGISVSQFKTCNFFKSYKCSESYLLFLNKLVVFFVCFCFVFFLEVFFAFAFSFSVLVIAMGGQGQNGEESIKKTLNEASQGEPIKYGQCAVAGFHNRAL